MLTMASPCILGTDELPRASLSVAQTLHDALVLLNANHADISFTLPPLLGTSRWLIQVDTSFESGRPPDEVLPSGKPYLLRTRSLVVLMEGKDRRIKMRPFGESNGDSNP